MRSTVTISNEGTEVTKIIHKNYQGNIMKIIKLFPRSNSNIYLVEKDTLTITLECLTVSPNKLREKG